MGTELVAKEKRDETVSFRADHSGRDGGRPFRFDAAGDARRSAGPALLGKKLQRRLNSGVDVVRHPMLDAGRRGIVNGPGEVIAACFRDEAIPGSDDEFPDQANTWSIDNFDTMLFRTWPSGQPAVLCRDVSYGAFNPRPARFTAPITADTNRAWLCHGRRSGSHAGQEAVRSRTRQLTTPRTTMTTMAT